MNIITENLDIEEWKPPVLLNVHVNNIEDTPPILDEIKSIHYENKQEFDDLKLQTNKNVEKDSLELSQNKTTQQKYNDKYSSNIKERKSDPLQNGKQTKCTPLKKHKCDICDKAFSLLGNLKKHIMHVHEGLKNTNCDKCNKAFSLLGNLKTHILSLIHI